MNYLSRIILVCLLFLTHLASAEFLDVEDAYKFSFDRKANMLIFNWDIEPGYFLYEKEFKLKTQNPDIQFGEPTFSPNGYRKYDTIFDEERTIYYDYFEVKVPYSAALDGEFTVGYQGCADAGLCYPPKKIKLRLSDSGLIAQSAVMSNSGSTSKTALFATQTANSSAELSSSTAAQLADSDEPENVWAQETSNIALWVAMASALLGGLILNLMPCVFPVLSLKAMQLAQVGERKADVLWHSWVYTFGVILSFLAIAASLLVIRSFGEAVGWGFQLQSPYFVAALVYIFFILSLSMAGIFHFGQGIMGMGQRLTQKPGAAGSFFTGVLATVVATPCTAPFMGSAIAAALSQPAWWALSVFFAMGLGLALPILIFSWIPALHRWMPKPGVWMDHFKQLMAFPLFATVAWLMWVFIELRGSYGFINLAIGLVVVAMLTWPALQRNDHDKGVVKTLKPLTKLATLATAIYLLVVAVTPPEKSLWVDYDKYSFQQLLKTEPVVLLDVTAAWCITCKANEKIALAGDNFEALVKEQNVTLVRADWTREDPDITALLEQFGRKSVPLYVVFKQGATPEILPQILTPNIVRQAISNN